MLTEVRQLIASARHAAASTVNTLQVLTNFEIGRRIVEHEQKGEKRAEYGAELLKELSGRLTEEFGKGFSPVNLSLMRKFFLTWKDRAQIIQQRTEKSVLNSKGHSSPDQPALCRFLNSLFGNLPSRSVGPTTSCFSPSITPTSGASTRW